jgi:hypothetical protein
MPTKPSRPDVSAAEPARKAPKDLKPKSKSVRQAASPTKSDLVISLLSRPDGATASELVSATGWQLHSLRAFISGLRKRGHAILRSKENGEARYAISSPETRP